MASPEAKALPSQEPNEQHTEPKAGEENLVGYRTIPQKGVATSTDEELLHYLPQEPLSSQHTGGNALQAVSSKKERELFSRKQKHRFKEIFEEKVQRLYEDEKQGRYLFTTQALKEHALSYTDEEVAAILYQVLTELPGLPKWNDTNIIYLDKWEELLPVLAVSAVAWQAFSLHRKDAGLAPQNRDYETS